MDSTVNLVEQILNALRDVLLVGSEQALDFLGCLALGQKLLLLSLGSHEFGLLRRGPVGIQARLVDRFRGLV